MVTTNSFPSQLVSFPADRESNSAVVLGVPMIPAIAPGGRACRPFLTLAAFPGCDGAAWLGAVVSGTARLRLVDCALLVVKTIGERNVAVWVAWDIVSRPDPGRSRGCHLTVKLIDVSTDVTVVGGGTVLVLELVLDVGGGVVTVVEDDVDEEVVAPGGGGGGGGGGAPGGGGGAGGFAAWAGGLGSAAARVSGDVGVTSRAGPGTARPGVAGAVGEAGGGSRGGPGPAEGEVFPFFPFAPVAPSALSVSGRWPATASLVRPRCYSRTPRLA